MSVFKLCAFADEADPSVSGQISALRENDIEMIELRGVDGRNVTELTTEEMRKLRKRLDDEGIKIWSIGSPIGKIEIEDDFKKHTELFRHTLELANIAGAEKMRIFSFFMSPEDAPKYKNRVIEQLGTLADIAKGSGVVLCHENEKDIYGDIPERCVDIHKAIPELRAVFDPANFVQCNVDTLTAWDMLRPYIDYMHMKDADCDKVIVPAGKGAGNVPQLLENYKSLSGGVITLEPHLFEFVGLAGLEREGATSVIGNNYNSKREAFDAGVNALKELIK
ncbi:MAG: sugar phosphate isomerase/epimerase [Oscillospiraceae bacterium]|nr:sugar phosphate isomerase/epimerase [Oscillospiraceae bacterium]